MGCNLSAEAFQKTGVGVDTQQGSATTLTGIKESGSDVGERVVGIDVIGEK
jgi:hypothetical protein